MKNMFALVAAGGTGSRMGARIPKQYIKVNGYEIIEWSVRKLISSGFFDAVIVCVPAEWREHTADIFADLGTVDIIAGGMDRNETLSKGIDHIEKKYGIDEETVVMTHDGARPLITKRMIKDSLEAVDADTPCVTAAVGAVDSFAASDGNMISGYPDRSKLYHIQTPQTFTALLYKQLSAKYPDKSCFTEATQIFAVNGYNVKLIEGDRKNIKVTNKEDLEIIRLFLGHVSESGESMST